MKGQQMRAAERSRHHWRFLCVLLVTAARAGTPVWAEKTHGLPRYETKYYNLYSALDRPKTMEAAARITRMFEEFLRRSKNFGRPPGRFPFYLFNSLAAYHVAGGREGSIGCFSPKLGLMAVSAGRPSEALWSTMQHEAFHQFCRYVITADMPIWANEGLAEYFERAIWTGDGYVPGIIPEKDLRDVRSYINAKHFLLIDKLVRLTRRQWDEQIADEPEAAHRNYIESWSLIHFLIHGEDGKYLKTLDGFLTDLHGGRVQRVQRFRTTIRTLQKPYTQWWTETALTDSHRREWKAVVATLTSFLARAHAQGQTFGTAKKFLAVANNDDLKLPTTKTTQWLPTTLLHSALSRMMKLKQRADARELAPKEWRLELSESTPRLIMVSQDGTTFTGSFRLKGGRVTAVVVRVKRPGEDEGSELDDEGTADEDGS